MLCFAVFALVEATMQPRHTYVEWKAWMGSDAMSAGLGMFLVALLTHMWVGLRDVLLDYAKPEGRQRVLLWALALILLSLAGRALQVLAHAHA